MLSPAEFSVKVDGIATNAVNATMISQLQALLQKVKIANMRVVPFQRINVDAPKTPIDMVNRTSSRYFFLIY